MPTIHSQENRLMNKRPLAHGNGIVTRPKKPKQSIAKLAAKYTAVAGIVGGGIVGGAAYIALGLILFLLALSPYILCLAAAAWLIYQII